MRDMMWLNTPMIQMMQRKKNIFGAENFTKNLCAISLSLERHGRSLARNYQRMAFSTKISFNAGPTAKNISLASMRSEIALRSSNKRVQAILEDSQWTRKFSKN